METTKPLVERSRRLTEKEASLLLNKVTHEDLRKAAVKWLINHHCSHVLSEMVTCATSEIPDAIGFQHHASYSVECKVSRSDFFANKEKSHVLCRTSVGEYRYFLVPSGLVKEEEIPEGYGLLYLSGKRIHMVKQPTRNGNVNLLAERGMLVSALRRVRTREFLTLNTCECCNNEVVQSSSSEEEKSTDSC